VLQSRHLTNKQEALTNKQGALTNKQEAPTNNKTLEPHPGRSGDIWGKQEARTTPHQHPLHHHPHHQMPRIAYKNIIIHQFE
jgi:hypothetical protein